MARKLKYRVRARPASYCLNFRSRGDARLVDVFDTVRAILFEYHQSCRMCGERYPFSFELVAHNLKHAGLYEAIIIDIFRHARQEFYPFTIDWYAVQYQEKNRRYLLTFALREIDLRELAAAPP